MKMLAAAALLIPSLAFAQAYHTNVMDSDAAYWTGTGWFNGDVNLDDDMGGLPHHWHPLPAFTTITEKE